MQDKTEEMSASFLFPSLEITERWTSSVDVSSFQKYQWISVRRRKRDAGYQGYNFRNFHGVVNPRDVESPRNNEFVVN